MEGQTQENDVVEELLDDLGDDKRALNSKLKELRPNGETISNPALRKELGWTDEDRYYRPRNALDDDGLLVRGVGYGGTVRFAPTGMDDVVTVPTQVAGCRRTSKPSFSTSTSCMSRCAM